MKRVGCMVSHFKYGKASIEDRRACSIFDLLDWEIYSRVGLIKEDKKRKFREAL